MAVSIHAPVKGATVHHFVARRTVDVSIHAPVKGATLQLAKEIGVTQFQSTRP